MELIIIKGDTNVGKTTTAALVHNELIERCNAELQWMMLDHWKFPLCEEDLVPDFQTAINYKEHTIGIISHGDSSRYLKGFIKAMINNHHPDILIICANTKEYIWNMLKKTFGDTIKEKNIFEVTSKHWSTDAKNKTSVKEGLVNDIISHINQIFEEI